MGQTKQNFNWQLNNSGFSSDYVGAALNFDNCVPTVLNNSLGSGFEGQSSISDSETGALLLYTDGYNIYNANNELMQNGSGAGLGNTYSQTIIIKKPGSSTLFYVITPDVQAGLVQNINYLDANGIIFAEVDMTLDGGLGGVTSIFNPLKPAGNCEMLTGVYHANGEDIWLIGHEYGNNNFFTFLITAGGINPVPTITPAGPVVLTTQAGVAQDSNFDAIGELKASLNGSKLAFTTYYNGYTCLVDFDNATGAISNSIELSLDGSGYGVSFSPDNTKLYFSSMPGQTFPGIENNSIYQFDISSNDQSTIQDSRTTIFNYEAGFRSLKMGPDGKIYVARTTTTQQGNGSSYIGVINEPNNLGLACNYVHDAVNLNGPYGTWGLNNSIEELYSCVDFEFSLGPDLDLCPGESAILTAVKGQSEYLWNTGQTTASVTVNQPGTYWIDVTGPDGSASDTIVVNYFSLPGIDINGESFICIDQETELSATAGFTDYIWNNGAETNSVLVGPGQWSVSALDDNGCLNSAVFLVDQLVPPLAQISGFEESCEGVPVNLSTAENEGQSFLWNTGQTETSIVVESSGTYSVTASNSCGTSSDSLTINFKNCDCEIFIPNAFTPDGDDINEVWKPVSCPAIFYELTIFDRWGAKIFSTSDQNESWIGNVSSGSHYAQNGVYSYVVQIAFENGEPEEYYGHVTLIR